MNKSEFDSERLIQFWVESSDEDFETMNTLYDSRRFSWSLFVGHLMIEKLLKAYFVKLNSDYPPFIHNLWRLAEKCKLEENEHLKTFLITVTAFNINARYDDYKQSFQKKCTEEFTNTWINQIKINRLWLKELISK